MKGYGGPELSLLVDKVAGPFVSLHGYVQFDVDFLQQPLWKLHAGVELAGGLATAKLLDIQYTVPFFTFDKIIAQSTDTPPVGAKVGSQPTSPSDRASPSVPTTRSTWRAATRCAPTRSTARRRGPIRARASC